MAVVVEDACKLRNDQPDGPSEDDGDLVCPACGSPCDSIHSVTITEMVKATGDRYQRS